MKNTVLKSSLETVLLFKLFRIFEWAKEKFENIFSTGALLDGHACRYAINSQNSLEISDDFKTLHLLLASVVMGFYFN